MVDPPYNPQPPLFTRVTLVCSTKYTQIYFHQDSQFSPVIVRGFPVGKSVEGEQRTTKPAFTTSNRALIEDLEFLLDKFRKYNTLNPVICLCSLQPLGLRSLTHPESITCINIYNKCGLNAKIGRDVYEIFYKISEF